MENLQVAGGQLRNPPVLFRRKLWPRRMLFLWGLCKPVIASTDHWPKELEMFTFLVILAMVVSESSFGTYVRPWGGGGGGGFTNRRPSGPTQFLFVWLSLPRQVSVILSLKPHFVFSGVTVRKQQILTVHSAWIACVSFSAIWISCLITAWNGIKLVSIERLAPAIPAVAKSILLCRV